MLAQILVVFNSLDFKCRGPIMEILNVGGARHAIVDVVNFHTAKIMSFPSIVISFSYTFLQTKI